MRQVPVRELNQHTAGVLARVERGERLAITRNGKPIAVLAPAEPDPFGELIESGYLAPATGPLPLVATGDSCADDSAGLEAVLADRYGDDARW